MFYFKFKDKECSLKIKPIQDLFVIMHLFCFSFLLYVCRFGEASAFSDVVCVALGTGVGAGVVIGGKLYCGRDNAQGQLSAGLYRQNGIKIPKPVHSIGNYGMDGVFYENQKDCLLYTSPTKTPVIFLTARGSVSDRVNGLRAGADVYLVKPFDIVELIARVESVLRRTGKTGDRYTVGDVCIDARAMRVTRGGEPVLLTPKEFDLLLLFVQNRNIALFRETIYERVWGAEFTGDSRTVDLHVQRLRRKLGWQGKLLTIYKTGYRLEVTD